MRALILLSLLTIISAQAEFNISYECSSQCRMTIFGAAEEFAYHSGASSTIITGLLVENCGEEMGNPLAQDKCQMPDEWQGSIEYAIQAGCVYEYYKNACKL